MILATERRNGSASSTRPFSTISRHRPAATVTIGFWCSTTPLRATPHRGSSNDNLPGFREKGSDARNGSCCDADDCYYARAARASVLARNHFTYDPRGRGEI